MLALPNSSPDTGCTQLSDGLVKNFSEADAVAIKAFEKTTNHDVKAVEYWIKDQVQGPA
jgi:adenylosuccinate lyase